MPNKLIAQPDFEPSEITVPGREKNPARGPQLEPVREGTDRTVPDLESVYSVVRYTPATTGAAFGFEEKKYEITGDHIYCAELASGWPVYLRIGPIRNPWIRLKAGAVYRRKFSDFRLKTDANTLLDRGIGTVEALLYVSHGELIANEPEPRPGLGMGYFADDTLVATVIAQNVFGGFDTGGNRASTLGKSGGILIIKNIDTANNLQISPQGGTGFPLYPGESISFYVGSKFESSGVPGTGIADSRMTVKAKVGTCAYAVFASPFEVDSMDPTGANSGGIQS